MAIYLKKRSLEVRQEPSPWAQIAGKWQHQAQITLASSLWFVTWAAALVVGGEKEPHSPKRCLGHMDPATGWNTVPLH